MDKIKNRWDIVKNWQYLFPILGVVLLIATAYYFSRKWLHLLDLNNTFYEWPFVIGVSALLYYLMLKFFLWCFEKLKHKWVTEYRWEMIAIFIVFAITGSAAARLAKPLTNFIGLDPEKISGWIYWPVRILIIIPIYQILLVLIGWLFGQHKFFWGFSKKMLKRFGLVLP